MRSSLPQFIKDCAALNETQVTAKVATACRQDELPRFKKKKKPETEKK